jgi:hypothetical protein
MTEINIPLLILDFLILLPITIIRFTIMYIYGSTYGIEALDELFTGSTPKFKEKIEEIIEKNNLNDFVSRFMKKSTTKSAPITTTKSISVKKNKDEKKNIDKKILSEISTIISPPKLKKTELYNGNPQPYLIDSRNNDSKILNMLDEIKNPINENLSDSDENLSRMNEQRRKIFKKNDSTDKQLNLMIESITSNNKPIKKEPQIIKSQIIKSQKTKSQIIKSQKTNDDESSDDSTSNSNDEIHITKINLLNSD